MRNDVKLGFAIGGVLLAVLIVYVLVVPGGSSQPKKVASAGSSALSSSSAASSSKQPGGTSGTASRNDPGKVTLEPVVPPPAGSGASQPVVPPPSYADSSKTTPAAPRTDPFARSDASGADALAKAPAKSDDWNTILNQQPMLMTETPVASSASTGGAAAKAAATPSASASAASESATSSPAGNDATASAAVDSSSAASSSGSTSSDAASTQPATPSGETASSSSAASSSGAATHTHRIQAGETLSSISTEAYGSPAYYPAIIKANPGIDPQRLKVGATINLPDASAVKPSNAGAGTPVSEAGAQHASAHIPGTAAVTIDSTKEYRVLSGDSLHKISIKLYGRSGEADKIYQLNKQTIGEDPHRLKVGQVLKLPEPPTVATSR